MPEEGTQVWTAPSGVIWCIGPRRALSAFPLSYLVSTGGLKGSPVFFLEAEPRIGWTAAGSVCTYLETFVCSSS